MTHHPRKTLSCENGTTFTFVTEGVETAVELARTAAGGRDVAISGGGSLARQCFAAGLIDEVTLRLAPVLLGDGVRLFDDPAAASLRLRQESVVVAPGVTRLSYCVEEAGRLTAARQPPCRGGSAPTEWATAARALPFLVK